MPQRLFTRRGWGLLLAGSACLVAAWIMGRRDLLTLAVLLVMLPLISLAGLRLLKPAFRVYRELNPVSVETGAATTVRLVVGTSGSRSGHTLLEENLPPRFGRPKTFRFPAGSASGSTSRYEYQLSSARRGQYMIGPVTAECIDPFGLSFHRRTIDDGDLLTVTPAAVELFPAGLAGARGSDGTTAARIRANPSEDDVMTREYRHGDAMRRVHWAATARHGTLMVRQEESVTTPEATILLDQRFAAFPDGPGTGQSDPGGPVSSRCFDWAVVAAMSVSSHLLERNHALRCLDPAGDPAFHRSPSAPEPSAEFFTGTAGRQCVAESLAAIGLSGHSRPRQRDVPSVPGQAPAPFSEQLMDKLSAHRMRGPLIALLGRMTVPEAQSLAAGAGYGTNAFAVLVTDQPDDCREVLQTLGLGGWRAVAVRPATSIEDVWRNFDEDTSYPVAPAAGDVRRGAEGTP